MPDRYPFLHSQQEQNSTSQFDIFAFADGQKPSNKLVHSLVVFQSSGTIGCMHCCQCYFCHLFYFVLPICLADENLFPHQLSHHSCADSFILFYSTCKRGHLWSADEPVSLPDVLGHFGT